MTAILKDNEFLPAAIELICAAQKKIYISTFKLELITKPRGARLKELFSALIDKAGAGLDVRLLCNNTTGGGHIPPTNAAAIRQLSKTKIKLRGLPNEQLVHAKMLLADKTKAIVGSHNLSVMSCISNFELSCMISDTITNTILYNIFEVIWDAAIQFS